MNFLSSLPKLYQLIRNTANVLSLFVQVIYHISYHIISNQHKYNYAFEINDKIF